MSRLGKFPVLCLLTLASLAGPAAAEESSPVPALGEPGSLLVAGAFQLTSEKATESNGEFSAALSLSPGARLFVARDLALGLDLETSWAWANVGNHALRLALLPSVGRLIHLGGGLTWLPQAQLRLELGDTATGYGSPSQTGLRLGVGAFLPLLLQSGRLFVGFGPNARVDVAGSVLERKAYALGLQSQLGGVF